MFRERLECPVLNRNRRAHNDIHRAGVKGRGVPGRDHLGVADDDRHDRHTGRHGQPERALLERTHRPGIEPGALRRDHHRQALSGEFLGLLQRFDRGLRVIAVNEDRVDKLAERAHQGIVLKFLLTHPGPVVLDQRANDHRVEVVAVVEDEHRGPRLGQVLPAQHIEFHAVGGQQQIRERGGEEVDTASATAGEQAPADGAVSGRHQRPDAQQGAHLAGQAAAAAAAEFQNRPTALAGHLGHLVAGIGGPWVAHQVHQRDVLVAVGVEVAVLQVDVVFGGELLHGVGLARAPKDRCHHLAGQDAVLVDLETIGQGVGDAEVARHRIHLDGQG